jgi:hypothetical protein
MTPRLRILFVLTAALLASSCTTVDNPASAPRAAAPPAAIGAAENGAFPVLKVGSTADEIVQLVGKPLEVTPKPSPEGKAEVWTYRRVVDQQNEQVASRTNTLPAVSLPGAMGAPTEIQYRLVHYTIFQNTSLLMFNGKLITAKQSFEKVANYDN